MFQYAILLLENEDRLNYNVHGVKINVRMVDRQAWCENWSENEPLLPLLFVILFWTPSVPHQSHYIKQRDCVSPATPKYGDQAIPAMEQTK